MLKISFVGDINPGGVLTYTGGVSQEVIDLLSKADLRVGTLECAIGDGKKMCPIKMANPRNGAIIYAPDECIRTLEKMQINVVSLANNHSLDLDQEGYQHTTDLLNKHGIKYLGAGNNIDEASTPLFLDVKDKRVCFLAYMEDCVPCIRFASANNPGVNPFTPQKVVDDIRRNRDKCDYIIVLPHWGKENTMWPRKEIPEWCKLFADAGADAVISSHTHVAQPVVKYGKCIVAPSMGNFLFPDRYIDTPRITVYPSNEERTRKDIPVVYKYPVVSQLTFKVIREKSRIGEILTIDLINNNEYALYIDFVSLDENNYLNINIPSKKFLKEYARVKRSLRYAQQYALILRMKNILAKSKSIAARVLKK